MFEVIRTYLAEVPVLADLLNTDLASNPSHATNTEEQRFHLEDIQQKLSKRLRDERRPYATVYFPEQEQTCAICKNLLHGYYWELNNPNTAKAVCVSYKAWHAFTQHEQSFITESMQNVSGVRVGEMRMVLDLGAMVAVLKNSSTPPEVLAELDAAIDAQKHALAAAGPIAAAGGGH